MTDSAAPKRDPRPRRYACMGQGPKHEPATIGEYKNQTHLIRGRSITVRNVEVRRCGCQTYPRIGPMLDLLERHPYKRVVTWHPRTKKWS